MKGKKGKIYAFLLTLCMLLTMIPATVFAADMKEFSLVITGEDDTISGGEGSITILHADGTFGETYDLKEISVTEEDYTYCKYAITVDVNTLADTDYFVLTWVCEGYEPIIEDPEMILEDDYYSLLGTVGWWKEECGYSCEDYWVETCAWDDSVRAWNEYYQVYETEGGLAVDYKGVWDETQFMKALEYVGADEKISSLWLGDEEWYNAENFVVNVVPGLSAKAMSAATKDSPSMEYFFDAENRGFASFDTIKGSAEFGIDLTKVINASVKKRFEEEDIKTNALTLNIAGDAKFTGTCIEVDMSKEFANIFSIPEKNITATEFGEEGYAYVSIVRYNAMKNDFDACGSATIVYKKYTELNNGEPTYTLVIEPKEIPGEIYDGIKESGSYTIIDAELPLHMYFGENVVVDDINTSMTTEEVTTTVTNAIEAAKEEGKTVEVPLKEATNIGADAMKAASDNNVPIVIEISDDATKSSFVNWSFDKITNPVEFNPSVHVDATVEAINTRLAGVTLPSTLKKTTVSFEFSGDLPGEANVTLNMADSGLAITDTAEGKVVFLYYFNPVNGVFELIDKAPVTGGYATFKMEHCSDYIVTTEELPTDATTDNSGNGGTGTTQPGGGATQPGGGATQPGGGAGQPDPGAATTQPDAGTNTGATTQPDAGTNTGATTQPDAGTTTPTSPKTGDTTVVAWIMVFALAMGTMLVIKKRNIVK